MNALNKVTTRRQIVTVLEHRPLNSIEISQALGISEKDVIDHLPHIAKSVVAEKKIFHIKQSVCIKCGYDFKGRQRFKRPGRCPRCRSTRIKRPVYEICLKC